MDKQVLLAIIFLIGLIIRLTYRYLMRNHPKEITKNGETKKYR